MEEILYNGKSYFANYAMHRVYDANDKLIGMYEVDHAIEQIFIDVFIDGAYVEVLTPHELYTKNHNNHRSLALKVIESYETT